MAKLFSEAQVGKYPHYSVADEWLVDISTVLYLIYVICGCNLWMTGTPK